MEEQTVSFRQFIKRHWAYLLLVLLISTLISALLCTTLIASCKMDYGQPYFSYSLICVFWTGVYMLCVIYPLLLWLGQFGVFAGFFKEKTYRQKKRVFISLLRVAIGVFGAYEILMHGHYRFRFAIISIYQNRAGAFIQFCLALLFLTIITTNFRRLFPEILSWNKTYPWFLKLLTVVLVSFVCFYNVEELCESKMLTYMDMRFLNMLYWTVLLGILFLIFRRVRISALITLVLSYIVGVANYVVVMFRGKEILWGDITAWGTAMKVVDNYTFAPDHYFFSVTGVFLLTFIAVLLFPLREKKQPVTKRRVCRTLLAEGAVILLLFIANLTGILYGNIQGNFWDYTIMMAKTGYIPYLISNINYSGKVTLEDYSASAAEKILKNSSALLEEETEGEDSNTADSSDSATDSANSDAAADSKAPNIIMIMDEAFSDLGVNGDLQTNQDYMPFFRSMSENTIKGYLHLSICGAPTANTEFEVLTRSSLAFLPTGCIPYNQYVSSPVPSLASVLKNNEYQYQTYAYHSYSATGYNRPVAYDYLGFDKSEFVEEDDMESYDTVREYVSDSSDFKHLEEIFEKKKDGNPLFLFNVTMQNHGGYTTSFDKGEDAVEVTNFDGDFQLENYLTLVKKTDNAVSELISYFSKEKEPVMIIFYGDHQPKLPDEALKPLMGSQGGSEDSGDGSSYYSDVASRYQVPFFIWTNYDSQKQQDVDISTNYLSSYILKNAGLPLTAYDEYLLELKDSYPVVTAREYWDAAGNTYEWDETKPSVLGSYENIQYNCLFDEKNKLTEFFNDSSE
ncbi:LTA synthase family protein [Hespellia stercorisuis]|uniref:Sulfatase n=1 Tax=Hespellia stercorisuis DSM 15480 TaxID=1121950 RepID=A0A1M6N9N2_9FIRM|nr:LTA synthase family protein [Hespellia stercorisuis]SHJ92402.1 Sulfatase [Hespellia stercorisuis DSM 15480]